MIIRTVQISDLSVIFAMNEAAVPHVNSIPVSDFERFIEISSYFMVVEDETTHPVGFMIVLGPKVEYDSLNYQYFSETYEAFDYVDRIVIDESARGKGYGSALYHSLMELSTQPRITCEVNIYPPNPDSLKFHDKLGFKEIAQQQTEGGKKTVSLQIWEEKDL